MLAMIKVIVHVLLSIYTGDVFLKFLLTFYECVMAYLPFPCVFASKSKKTCGYTPLSRKSQCGHEQAPRYL